MAVTVLPLAYLGNTHYFAKMLGEDCIIDLHEHYRKQSYRSRCEILSPGGITPLTVQIKNPGNWPKTTVRDVRIDYSKRWQHQHWNSIVASYASAPYFDHFAPLFEPFYTRRFEFLADLNTGLLEIVIKLLGADMPRFSEKYIEPGEGIDDWREGISPKPQYALPDPKFRPQPYYQPFPLSEGIAPSHGGFVPGLSIIDLLFCEGLQAWEILRRSYLPSTDLAPDSL